MKAGSRFSRPYGTRLNRLITFPAMNRWAILIPPLRDGTTYNSRAEQDQGGYAYRRTSRTYTVARAICSAAKGMASFTKRPKDIARPFL